MRNIIIVLLVFGFGYSIGQIPKDLGINSSSMVNGRIELKNGETITGQFRHNQFLGTVQYYSNNEPINVQESSILGIKYKDPETNKDRTFQTFEFINKETDKRHEMLFEILKDYKHFAVLSRTMPVAYLGNFGSYDIAASRKNGVLIGQAEIILFVGEKLELEPYLVMTDLELNRMIIDYSKSKSKIIDHHLIDEYLEEKADEVKSFAKMNKLKFNSKEDLIKLLDYYDELAKE